MVWIPRLMSATTVSYSSCDGWNHRRIFFGDIGLDSRRSGSTSGAKLQSIQVGTWRATQLRSLRHQLTTISAASCT